MQEKKKKVKRGATRWGGTEKLRGRTRECAPMKRQIHRKSSQVRYTQKRKEKVSSTFLKGLPCGQRKTARGRVGNTSKIFHDTQGEEKERSNPREEGVQESRRGRSTGWGEERSSPVTGKSVVFLDREGREKGMGGQGDS